MRFLVCANTSRANLLSQVTIFRSDVCTYCVVCGTPLYMRWDLITPPHSPLPVPPSTRFADDNGDQLPALLAPRFAAADQRRATSFNETGTGAAFTQTLQHGLVLYIDEVWEGGRGGV